MSVPVSYPAGADPGRILAFSTEADETVGTRRSVQAEPLGRDDRLALLVLGGGFAAVAVALYAGLSDPGSGGMLVTLMFIGLYALVSRVEFEVFTGASVPTMLVFVPMLFVLPLDVVPLAVAIALMLGATPGWIMGRTTVGRVLLNLVGSWHVVGPVVVLSVVGDQLVWSRWPIYVLVLASQFVTELAAVTSFEWIARRTSPVQLIPHLARAQVVDMALAPVGLAFAFVAVDEPLSILAVLPLVAVLRVFASERRARIDNALELSAAYRGTAFLLGDVVEADDTYTGLHSRDVVELSVAVAEEIGLTDSELRATEFAALLHDIGKIRVPSEIINKPGALDADETALMETHTLEGQNLLEQVGGTLGAVGLIVRSCHERWDGGGYPDGLAGEAIPRVARIVSCCDAFSAMTTNRSYRKALPMEKAVEELEANAGTQFDPAVVRALLTVLERRSDLSTR